uniref:Ras-related GTP-binding protein n=1 Tax=Geotrypetes seraphini TaxID=260995 RepID=A0A6P8S587_GEOSA|nr:ras-related GTP-binding protein C [Geotrypetes seraphini]
MATPGQRACPAVHHVGLCRRLRCFGWRVASASSAAPRALGRWPSARAMSLPYGDEEPLAGSYGAVDSFPKDFGYGVEEVDMEESAAPADSKPRILLMGLRRSGKSSIQKVVFHKMSPNETLFLESTNKIYKDDISNSSFVNFQIWDFPGQVDFFDPTFDYEMIFRGTGALIYVIDAQDDYMEALTRLHITVSKAYKVNPDMNFEVFIHKVDGLSDDHKIETQRDIHQRANDDLADAGLEKLHLSFYLTSIYDHSIFEAFSKVVQKLIPQLPTLENLLNIFISNSGIEKAFLFDVVSKIYIATDSSPVDMQSYELCCDMIDVVIDVSCIYGLKEDGSGSAYDKESMAIIKLNNTTVLYLKEVTKFLALVCILREESFERKGLIDYNFHCFRKAIHEVFEVGVVSHRTFSHHQASTPNLNAVTLNGTPANVV